MGVTDPDGEVECWVISFCLGQMSTFSDKASSIPALLQICIGCAVIFVTCSCNRQLWFNTLAVANYLRVAVLFCAVNSVYYGIYLTFLIEFLDIELLHKCCRTKMCSTLWDCKLQQCPTNFVIWYIPGEIVTLQFYATWNDACSPTARPMLLYLQWFALHAMSLLASLPAVCLHLHAVPSYLLCGLHQHNIPVGHDTAANEN